MSVKRKNKINPDKVLNAFIVILVLFAIIAMVPNIVAAIHKFHPEYFPESRVNTYVSSIVDENGEERSFLEVEYWENLDNSGNRVLEIRFNSYTDPQAAHVVKRGVQFELANKNVYESQQINYEKDGGASWRAVNKIDTGTNMYVRIDDQAFSLKMDGTYIEYDWNFNFGKGFVNFFKWGFANEKYHLDIRDKSFGYTRTETVRSYTMNDFYATMFNCVDTNAAYGENMISLLDLAKFFSIKKQTPSGEFVDIESGAGADAEYFSVHTIKHREGFVRAEDSDFGMYMGDGEFTLVETDKWLDDFTNIVDSIILTEKDFDYVACPAYEGVVAVLKDNLRAMLAPDAVVQINMDLDNVKFSNSTSPVVGILYDFAKVDKITLTFNQITYPLFYEFYRADVGRQYLPSNADYVIQNKADPYIGITNIPEVEI